MKRLHRMLLVCASQLVLFAQASWAADNYLPFPQGQEDGSEYTLTLNTVPQGAGSFNRSSGNTFSAGESVYMYYYANADYVFDYWQTGDSVISSDRYFYFTMPDHDATLTAVFHYAPANPGNPDMPEKKYTLTLNTIPQGAGSFNRSSGSSFSPGESVYMYCYNKEDYVFDYWQSGDTVISRDRSFYFTIPDHDATLTAVYTYSPGNPADPDATQLNYTVTLQTQPAGAGSFNWNAITYVEAGSSSYIYAYNNTDYVFREWQQDGKTVGTDRQYNFTMPAEDIKLVAVYDYRPSNPGNPGANYWNDETGEIIVDDFKSGYLSDAVYYATNGNYNAVQMITVAGPVSQYDWGVVNNYGNCTFLDMSRTYGLTCVPSYNFSGNQVLTTIAIPAGIEVIDYYAFYNCSSLSSISVYASTPPTIGYNAFYGIADSIVYVPVSAVPLYQQAEGWKDFTILPLAKDVSSLEVNLPDGTDVALYKDMFIELLNTVSGQKQRYVITNRLTYTFSSLPKRTNYNLYLRNAQGNVLGEIDDLAVPDGDVSVTFDNLMVPRDITLQVLTPTGDDVTDQTSITWYDQKDTYLTRGNILTGQLEGVNVRYRIQLPQTLAMQYLLPADSIYRVVAANDIAFTLTDIPQATIGGQVFDIKTNQPITGATVAVSQMLNGLYSKSFTTKTNNNGQWSLQVYEASTNITASMDNYVSKTQMFETLVTDVPTFELKDINGTTISLNLTYQPTAGELQQYYSDYANVAFTVSIDPSDSLAAENPQLEYNVQYPQIVFMEQLPAGTLLRVTATSKNQKFVPVSATAIVDDLDRASVTLPIVQLGGISASFRQTDNMSVVGILYDANGRLIKKYNYTSAALNISELQDGQYTLVTMASTQLFSAVGSLSQFAEAGLREGTDYVKNTVTVRSGEMAAINNALIPFLDETKLYYTGSATSITVNKSQITTGNYLTVTGHLDFKSAYAGQVSDVKFIVNLPQESAFVDNSVMRGGQTATYTYSNNQVVVPLDYYGERVRFCFIPTVGGEFTATGSVQFTLNGKTITQPIGKVNYTVKNLSIQVPSIVAKTTVPVSGTAAGKGTVEVYDNGTLLGQTKALANGAWATTVELNNPYNLSTHSIYAKITTSDGVEMQSESKNLTYDINAIQVQKVTMYHYNPEWNKTFESEFDFQNPHTVPNKWTVYYPNKKFTYTVDFTNNSPEKISNVILYVHAADGQIVPLYPTYDEKKDIWVADIDMGNRSDGYYPVNVSIDYDAVSTPIVDDKQIGDQIASLLELADELDAALLDIADDEMDIEYNSVDESEFLSFEELMEWDESFADNDTIVEIDADSVMQAMQVIRNLFTLNIGSELVLDDGTIVTTNTCDGIDEASLEAQGYTKYTTTSNKAIYTFSEGNVSIVIDFADNLYLKIEGSGSAYAPGRRAPAYDTFKDWVDKLKSALVSVQDAYKDMEDLIGDLVENLEKDLEKYTELAIQYGTNYKSFNTKYENAVKLYNSGTLDPWQLNELETKIASYKAARDKWKKLFDAANKSKKITEKTLPIAKKLLPILKKVCPVLKYVDLAQKGISIIWDYWNIYGTIPDPCNADQEDADNLRAEVVDAGSWVFGVFSSKLIIDGALDISVAAQAAAAVPTGGVSAVTAFATAASKMVVSIVLDAAFDSYNNSKKNSLIAAINALKCDGDGGNGGHGGNGDNGGNGGGTGSGSTNDDVQIDPSGYVYEGVASNRLQGVTATAYYKETVEDMYGDLHENIVLWNAEDYAQENPLFTDEYGMYQWDVPQGLWMVKFEKEGYQTTQSEWLPVPPPQLEVNIGMVQMLQPSVVSAKAFDEGIEIVFNKYMNPESLTTDNIILTRNGEVVQGIIELLDQEVAYEGQNQTYASKVLFSVPEGEELLSTDEIQLTVRKSVESYAGMQMQDDFTQAFDVEPKVRTIAVDSLINVAYGGERTLIVAALPADASKGKTMRVQSLSKMIATIDSEELTLDENGQAELKVNGELPGSTVVSFTVDDSDVKGSMKVNVKEAVKLVTFAPRASRVSGTEVYRGTVIRLTSETEDAEIWYTLDGSCPCESETALKYNADEPIIIASDNVTIKAMAQGHDLAESEVAEFSYKLKTSALGYQLPEGWTWISHNMEESVPTSTFQTGAERIVSQTEEIINDPSYGFIGTLRELEPATGYKIKQKSEGDVKLSGYEWNAVSQTVPVETGWNWIGYPLNQTMTVDEALAFFTPSEGDYIVGQDGFSQYSDGGWHGTLEGLKPGQGLLYKSAGQNEIPFNTTIVSNAVSHVGRRMMLMDSPWAVDKHAYPNITPITALLYEDGMQCSDGDYVVAAFSGDECRGVGQWKEGRLLMNIYGVGNEEINFLAFNKQTESVYIVSDTIEFSLEPIGSWIKPYSLIMGDETTSVDELYSDLTVTPYVAFDHISVTAGGHDISSLSLTDMSGRTLFRMDVNGKGATIATSQLPEGVYIITVVADGRSYYHKIVKTNK